MNRLINTLLGNKNKFTSGSGFTLAEVLVTLSIIGIVAALTLPTLMIKLQESQYKTAFKKNYAMISQAAMRVMDDNGGTIAGVGYNPGDGPYNPYTALTTYSKYLSYIKRCGDYTGRPYSQCFSNFHTKDGTSVIASNGNWWSFAILRDGTSIRFATQASGTIEIMDVDVNGTKAPNIVGRDIFRLVVYGNTIKPNGPTWNPWAISASINTGDDCTSGAGWTCSEKVINNADYAW